MSFGESMLSVGLFQKTVKEDQNVKLNRAYPWWKLLRKVLEDSGGLHTEAGDEMLTCGAAQPLGPPVSLCVVMSVPHRLLGSIYAVA